jgi:hypothetical protein
MWKKMSSKCEWRRVVLGWYCGWWHCDIDQPQCHKYTKWQKKSCKRKKKDTCDIMVDQCHQCHQPQCHLNIIRIKTG